VHRIADLAQWLAAAKAGDLPAFEHILATYEAMVLRVSYRLLGNRADAHDAAQEVFVKLYRCLKRIDETRDLAPWLSRVTVNECRDLRRVRREIPLDEAPEPMFHDGTVERLAREEQRAVRARRSESRRRKSQDDRVARPGAHLVLIAKIVD
jgi:RNA polymerase sigma-70 factor, ECF subfamily